MMSNLEELRFPIGRFRPPAKTDDSQIRAWIDDIEALPADLGQAVEPLSESQLDTPYRPQGWTLRQVVHHLPESHINAFVRFKWTLTEDSPRIKPYSEDRWAKLSDYSVVPVTVSLTLLDALHRRWVGLLRSLAAEDLKREFIHPDSGPANLAATIPLYAWHGRHHLAHIEQTIQRQGWKA